MAVHIWSLARKKHPSLNKRIKHSNQLITQNKANFAQMTKLNKDFVFWGQIVYRQK